MKLSTLDSPSQIYNPPCKRLPVHFASNSLKTNLTYNMIYNSNKDISIPSLKHNPTKLELQN